MCTKATSKSLIHNLTPQGKVSRESFAYKGFDTLSAKNMKLEDPKLPSPRDIWVRVKAIKIMCLRIIIEEFITNSWIKC